ncbi:MAG TPA: glycosyltransferase 87 family protein, partial [Candidatus Polarisedimenticolaceae bacterium]|nr:glycosyltransferase 87 family protein [Candidatus Polarisedimenticolaceae bacterium]
GSGHLDAAPMALVLAAVLATSRGRSALTGLALGIATLFKLYPVVVFPALWRPRDWRMPLAFLATVALGYLPYAGVGTAVLGFLPGYVREEGLLAGSPYFLLQAAEWAAGRELPAWLYLGPAALVLIGLAIWTLRRRAETAHQTAALVLGVAAVVAVSPHYAWYFAWLLPLAALTRCLTVLLLGVTAFVLYLSLLWDTPATRLWSNACVYLPALALLLVLWRRHRRPEGAATGAPV